MANSSQMQILLFGRASCPQSGGPMFVSLFLVKMAVYSYFRALKENDLARVFGVLIFMPYYTMPRGKSIEKKKRKGEIKMKKGIKLGKRLMGGASRGKWS